MSDNNENRQRWWVDYTNSVRSGYLLDVTATKSVLRGGDEFFIVDSPQVKRSYMEACADLMDRLSKMHAESSRKMASILQEVAKAAERKGEG